MYSPEVCKTDIMFGQCCVCPKNFLWQDIGYTGLIGSGEEGRGGGGILYLSKLGHKAKEYVNCTQTTSIQSLSN